MSDNKRPPLVEILLLAAGIILSAAAGFAAYTVVGLYGDGPFAQGYHRERDPSTGRSLLVQEYMTPQGKVRRVIDEQYRVKEFRVDTNLDGTDDGSFTLEAGRLSKVGFSLAGDGVVDAWAFRDESNQIVRIEVSTKRDGRVDRWEHYENGQMVRVDLDTNLNGRPDQWQILDNGIVVETVLDVDEDGKPDAATSR